MTDATSSGQDLIQQFLATLRGLPHARAELAAAGAPPNLAPDAQINFDIAGKSMCLLAEVKKAVYPRDVRQILWQLKKQIGDAAPQGVHGRTLSVLVADSISPGAKEVLRTEHVAYYDSGGSFYLAEHDIYIFIDKPPPKSLARSMRSLFSGRRAHVIHCLLIRHKDWLSVKEISEQVGVSPATASQVLTELERFDWLETRGQGPNKQRHVREPTVLLDTWAKQVIAPRPTTLRRYFVPSFKPEVLMKYVAEVFATFNVEYAVTHEAAAQRYAPYLTSISQVRCRILAGPSAEQGIAKLEARVVNEGANFAVIEAKSTGDLLFKQWSDGVCLASPIQVYLDLMHGEGRTKEMAMHLRKERIGF